MRLVVVVVVVVVVPARDQGPVTTLAGLAELSRQMGGNLIVVVDEKSSTRFKSNFGSAVLDESLYSSLTRSLARFISLVFSFYFFIIALLLNSLICRNERRGILNEK